jgi:hypothetical protein
MSCVPSGGDAGSTSPARRFSVAWSFLLLVPLQHLLSLEPLVIALAAPGVQPPPSPIPGVVLAQMGTDAIRTSSSPRQRCRIADSEFAVGRAVNSSPSCNRRNGSAGLPTSRASASLNWSRPLVAGGGRVHSGSSQWCAVRAQLRDPLTPQAPRGGSGWRMNASV